MVAVVVVGYGAMGWQWHCNPKSILQSAPGSRKISNFDSLPQRSEEIDSIAQVPEWLLCDFSPG